MRISDWSSDVCSSDLPEKTVVDNILYVNATEYTPLDSTLITTGEIQPVAGTPFDFTEPVPIETAVARDPSPGQLQFASGLDHNIVLNTGGGIFQMTDPLMPPRRGIPREVYTNVTGRQVTQGSMPDMSERQSGW